VNRDLIQVGRDYIRYIHFQIDSGNIGGALLNIAVIVILYKWPECPVIAPSLPEDPRISCQLSAGNRGADG
jgi:hypothetical protein